MKACVFVLLGSICPRWRSVSLLDKFCDILKSTEVDYDRSNCKELIFIFLFHKNDNTI